MHALCNAHLLRELVFLHERQTQQIFARYHAILDEGSAINPEAKREGARRGCIKPTPTINLLRRMREHADDVLRFVTDLRVPFTNNPGERAIRMPEVKQKISGCFRTLNGAENLCIIRSYLDTMHKQGHNTFELLRHAFMGNPLQPALC